MADIGGSNTDAFMSGVAHQVNPGRQNLGSLTLGGSFEQSAVTPHGVLATTVGASQDDGIYQDYLREQGGYQPGSFENMSDQIDQGSSDNLP